MHIKEIVQKAYLHLQAVYRWFFVEHRGLVEKIVSRREYMLYQRAGKLNPPEHQVKQRNIKYLAKLYDCTILVETGTFKGDMVEAMKDNFDTIYSIELDNKLYITAKNRFAESSHIHIIHGDSTEELPRIMEKINMRTIFWLDGHYCGDNTSKGIKLTPILEELKTIFAGLDYGHVILIDDARLFNGTNDYPTFPELITFLKENKPDVLISVEDDAIRLAPGLR